MHLKKVRNVPKNLMDQNAKSLSATVWGSGTRSRLYKSVGFFFLCWSSHYFPFYLMGRQRFLHHYLPAHVASALVTGALVEFIFNIDPANLDDETGKRRPLNRRLLGVRARLGRQSILAAWGATVAILGAVIWCFVFFAPLTYGTPGLTADGVIARKWLGYDLHFAK